MSPFVLSHFPVPSRAAPFGSSKLAFIALLLLRSSPSVCRPNSEKKCLPLNIYIHCYLVLNIKQNLLMCERTQFESFEPRVSSVQCSHFLPGALIGSIQQSLTYRGQREPRKSAYNGAFFSAPSVSRWFAYPALFQFCCWLYNDSGWLLTWLVCHCHGGGGDHHR